MKRSVKSLRSRSNSALVTTLPSNGQHHRGHQDPEDEKGQAVQYRKQSTTPNRFDPCPAVHALKRECIIDERPHRQQGGERQWQFCLKDEYQQEKAVRIETEYQM